MYNETLKRRFLAEQDIGEKTKTNIEAVFNIIAPYEEKWGADICTRSAEEIEPVIKKLATLRVHSLVARSSHIKRYMKWCFQNAIPGATEAYRGIDSSSVNRMRDMTVANPVQLQTYLNKIFPPVEAKTVDIIYRCYFWMAYSGMLEDDVYSVKASDIDFDSGYINYKGVKYELYRESVPALQFAATSDVFIHENGKSIGRNAGKPRFRVEGESVIRGYRSQPVNTSMRAKLSRKIKAASDNGDIGKRLSYSKVWFSGMFFRAKQRELMGYAVNFEKDAERNLTKTDFNTNEDKTNRIKQVAGEYMRDYRRWKEAWGL